MENKNYIVFDIETTGLNPWYDNRITCICARDHEGNEFKQSGDNEEEVILEFINWINKHEDYFFISANGKDFDIPFIMTRCMWHNISLFNCEFFLRKDHYDLQQLTYKKISLNDMATLFLGIKKSGNGMQAIVLATEKRFNELTKYCMDDVLITEKVYHKLMELQNGKN